VAWRLVVFALGMGFTMGPATESIMGSLPRSKAGVGSAVNDTTRQVGGALGVAIVGSVMSSAYGHRIASAFADTGAPPQAVEVARDGLGQALEVIRQAPIDLATSERLTEAAKEAFVFGLHRGVLVGAAAAFVGAVVAFVALPAQAGEDPGHGGGG
jgi:hypothetical protein